MPVIVTTIKSNVIKSASAIFLSFSDRPARSASSGISKDNPQALRRCVLILHTQSVTGSVKTFERKRPPASNAQSRF